MVQVHDLVDWVSEEARRAGRGAARFIQGSAPAGAELAARAGEGVRYVVPQRVRTGCLEGGLDLMLRVARPFRDHRLTLRCGGTVVHQVRRPRLAPGEMERLRVPAAKLAALTGDLVCSVEEA